MSKTQGQSSRSSGRGSTVTLGGTSPVITVPKILMPQDVFLQIRAYIDEYPIEICGIGSVVRAAPHVHIVEKVYLVRQTHNHAAAANITVGHAEFVAARAEEGRTSEDIRFFWHSHVRFPVQWSKEDEDTVKLLTRTAEDDYTFISFVMNKYGEFRLRFDLYHRELQSFFTFDDLPLELVLRPSVDVRAAARADIERLAMGPLEEMTADAAAAEKPGVIERVRQWFGGSGESDGHAASPEDSGSRRSDSGPRDAESPPSVDHPAVAAVVETSTAASSAPEREGTSSALPATECEVQLEVDVEGVSEDRHG